MVSNPSLIKRKTTTGKGPARFLWTCSCLNCLNGPLVGFHFPGEVTFVMAWRNWLQMKSVIIMHNMHPSSNPSSSSCYACMYDCPFEIRSPSISFSSMNHPPRCAVQIPGPLFPCVPGYKDKGNAWPPSGSLGAALSRRTPVKGTVRYCCPAGYQLQFPHYMRVLRFPRDTLLASIRRKEVSC